MKPLPLVLALVLAAGCGGKAKPSSRIVFDCEKASYKPTEVLAACGDGGLRLTHLAYSSWTETEAVAMGTAEANLCVPNCAQGTFTSYPAVLVFDLPLKRKDHTILSRVKITYPKANPFGDKDETHTLTELNAPRQG